MQVLTGAASNSLPRVATGPIELALDAFDERFELVLVPSSVFTEDARIIWGDGEDARIEKPEIIGLTGIVRGVPRSRVKLTLHKNAMSGTVRANGETYVVEARGTYFDDAAPDEVIVYRYSDVDIREVDLGDDAEPTQATSTVEAPLRTAALTSEDVSLPWTRPASFSLTSGEIQGEKIAVVADWEYFVRLGGNEPDIVAEIHLIIDIANDLSLRDLGVSVAIKELQVFDTQQESNSWFNPAWGSLFQLLKGYRNAKFHMSNGMGITHMLTGRQDLPVGGAARGGIYGMCLTRESVSFRIPGNLLPDKALFSSHELGHNFGAPHDFNEDACGALTIPRWFCVNGSHDGEVCDQKRFFCVGGTNDNKKCKKKNGNADCLPGGICEQFPDEDCLPGGTCKMNPANTFIMGGGGGLHVANPGFSPCSTAKIQARLVTEPNQCIFDVPCGDVVTDGQVTASDALKVNQMVVCGLPPPECPYNGLADVEPDGAPDGVVTVTDWARILNIASGISQSPTICGSYGNTTTTTLPGGGLVVTTTMFPGGFGLETTTTTLPLPETIFSDGFESGNFTIGGWTLTSTPEVISGSPGNKVNTGSYAARLNGTDAVTKLQPLCGCEDVVVSYWRRTTGRESGDHLIAEWQDGATGAWTILEDVTGNAAWAEKVFELPASVENLRLFSLRFRSVAGDSEHAYVDDVDIQGIPPDLSLCGNGYVNAGEECDDSNTAYFDGCSGICGIESGALCD